MSGYPQTPTDIPCKIPREHLQQSCQGILRHPLIFPVTTQESEDHPHPCPSLPKTSPTIMSGYPQTPTDIPCNNPRDFYIHLFYSSTSFLLPNLILLMLRTSASVAPASIAVERLHQPVGLLSGRVTAQL
ncbi:hypothetical protein RRG08_038240 [Elysia crispata]|uniref:Uncharacterized protein n=1 Tax=Elysia crispata TaxID=231223 RepID=A0AAE1AMZ1_9GAST|nr:hypothetical protein RRG08_038240 [Elysia crispata]